ncbi:MAG: glycosyltransferase [Proteobacteria bacterium]|nr:glycosyltransferase [Pseudomonadota bacterium]
MKKVSIVVINYNGYKDLTDCLSSLGQINSPDYEIIIIDNGSTDDSVDLIRSDFPMFKLIALPKNYGHSYACNVAFREAQGDYVLLMDYDTIVGEEWIAPLLETMECEKNVGICVSRAIFYPAKEKIHSDGGWPHYVGNMTLKNGFALVSKSECKVEEIGAAGTTSMLVDKRKALEVGGFDEDYFVYLNDFEFSMRMRLAGYSCFSNPKSIIYHKGGNPDVSYRGEGKYPPLRAFYIFRNRWLTIFKLYSIKTIIGCLPALLIYEIAIISMAFIRGLFLTYMKALLSALRNLPQVYRKRKIVQAMRKISDSELLTAYPLSFVPGSVGGGLQGKLVHMMNALFSWYWKVVKVIL